VDVSTQVGRTIRIFDWTGVNPIGRFDIASPYFWDSSQLYSTGEVTLLVVPKPPTLSVAALGGIATHRTVSTECTELPIRRVTRALGRLSLRYDCRRVWRSA
jgi:hypothetical protein